MNVRSRPSAYRSHAARELARYLRSELERADGDLYVNGARLAGALGRPPGEIDRLLRELSGTAPGLHIALDPDAPETLWRVSRP